MAKRKTIGIRQVLDKVNNQLAKSTCGPEGRFALCTMIESILMDNDVYAGFKNLEAKDCPVGQLPGCVRNPNYVAGGTEPFYSEYPDDSRRYYYVHRYLKD